MNELLKKILLTGDKSMLELDLRKPGSVYSARGTFTKLSESIQRFVETCYITYIYKNELDIASFAHDAVYADSKALTKRAVSDKVLLH